MKDFLGKTIKEGDEVVFPWMGKLWKGYIQYIKSRTNNPRALIKFWNVHVNEWDYIVITKNSIVKI